MDEILVANFMIFQEMLEDGLYDLVIGNKAWEIDHFWHENPELKRGSHVWMTDFVGYLPMPDGGEREAFLTTDYNAEMIEHIARFPRIRDRAVFVGNPDDVISESFGPDLPKIPDWTEEHFDFSGYITRFTPPDPSDVEGLREELGFAPGEKAVVVTVGSDQRLKIMAKDADGWLASGYNTTPAQFAEARRRLDGHIEAFGRDLSTFPDMIATMWVYVASDQPEADRLLHDVLAPMLRREPDTLAAQLPVGSPEHCVNVLSAYADAGAQQILLWPIKDAIGQLHEIAEHVKHHLSS